MSMEKSMAHFLGLVLLTWPSLRLTTADLQWEKLVPSNSVMPPARRDAAIGFDGKHNQIIVFGGRSSTILDDTWIFNITNRTWMEIPPTVISGSRIPSARFTIVSGFYNDKFLITTGEGKNKVFFNDVLEFDFNTLKWKVLSPLNANNAPKVRYGASGGTHPDGDALFVTHGFAGTRYSDTFKFDLRTNRWVLVHDEVNQYDPYGPHARCLQSGTMVSVNQMILFGGCLSGGKTGGPCPSQDSWILNTDTKKWTELETCASPRMYSAMALLPAALSEGKNISVAVMYGGVEKNDQVLQVTTAPKREVMIFIPETKKWERKDILADLVNGCPSTRSGNMMVTSRDGIVLFGGRQNSGGNLLNDLWLLKGTSVSAIRSRSSGKCRAGLFNLIALHGIFMFLGWGVLLQLGAFIARYLRRKDPLWFKLHRIFQSIGLLLAIGGLVCAILSVRFDHMKFPHAIIGIVVMAAGIFQPINAFVRPHKPKTDTEKSTKRTVWELVHKGIGRLTLLLALANVTLGLFLGLASRKVWIVWFAYLGLIMIMYIIAEMLRLRDRKRTGTSEFQMQYK